MARYTIIVDRLSDWIWQQDGIQLMTVDSFLINGTSLPAGSRLINLCRRYTYMSAGYYCSLLAEARNQLPMPTLADVLCLAKKSLYSFALPEIEQRLERTVQRLDAPPADSFTLTVFFGHAEDERFKRLAALTFDIFRYPILALAIRKTEGRWRIDKITPLGLHNLPEILRAPFNAALRAYTRARRPLSGGRPPALYNLAILVEPGETLPPSDTAAIERFIKVGQALRMDVELITRADYDRIPEFDALFIRATTGINHYTYQFARKAEIEGLAVMDDPNSILRCGNKVFLHELLRYRAIPAPKSETVDRLGFDDAKMAQLEDSLGYPIVLKIPDGSFSRGMRKANNRRELLEHASELLKQSRLILAQEYVYTEFDWRVGVLRGEPLYVCQYKMARKHWQIVAHRSDGTYREGGYKTFALDQAPAELIEMAVAAAAPIGDGLYGVDIKQTDKGLLVIEVNDNPSLDRGVEDKVIGDALYRKILEEFIRRIDA